VPLNTFLKTFSQCCIHVNKNQEFQLKVTQCKCCQPFVTQFAKRNCNWKSDDCLLTSPVPVWKIQTTDGQRGKMLKRSPSNVVIFCSFQIDCTTTHTQSIYRILPSEVRRHDREADHSRLSSRDAWNICLLRGLEL